MPKQYIKIRGANEHNLKNISVDIPRNELVFLPDFPVPASHLWRLIRSMQKVRDAIWSLCLPMQDSS